MLSVALYLLALLVVPWGESRAPVESPGPWRSIGPDGAMVLAFAADPAQPDTIYAMTPGRLFRGTDAGASWGDDVAAPASGSTRMAIAPAELPFFYVASEYGGFVKSADGGQTWSSAGLEGGAYDVAVDPADSGRVLAGSFSGFWLTEDRGETWRNVLGPGGYAVWFDRTDSGRAFAGGFLGLFRSEDSGSTWAPTPGPAGVMRFAQDPSAPGVLYAEKESDGLWKTVDGGDSWVSIGQPLGRIRALEVGATGIVYGGINGGLGVSRDGGLTFVPVPSIPVPVTALFVEPAEPGNVYVAARHNVYRTSDGAASFVSSNRGLINPGSSVGMDPLNPRRLFLAVDSYPMTPTVYRSPDSGSTWTLSDQRVWTSKFAFDPTDDQIVYAGGVSMYRSFDGGIGWEEANAGLILISSALLLDPFDPATLYVGSCCGPNGFAAGVFRSTDRGTTWTQAINGFPPPYPDHSNWQVGALAADTSAPGVIYAATGNGILKSTDRGEHWGPEGLGLPLYSGHVLAVDPSSPQTVYAPPYRSDDGGESWRQLEGLADVTSLVVDPTEAGVLYLGSRTRGVLRSTDGGVTSVPWSESLRDPCVGSLAIDANGRLLVAGTCTNGIYERRIRRARPVSSRPASSAGRRPR